MIQIKRMISALVCALVMGCGAELHAVGFSDVRAKLAGKPSWVRMPSRADLVGALPTERVKEWVDDNIRTPKDEDRAGKSFARRRQKLEDELQGLEEDASYVAPAASLQKRAAKLHADFFAYFLAKKSFRVHAIDDSGNLLPGVDMDVNFEHFCNILGVSIRRVDQLKSGGVFFILSKDTRGNVKLNEKGCVVTTKVRLLDSELENFEKIKPNLLALNDYEIFEFRCKEKLSRINIAWNKGKITRFLPATKEQRYGALSGTLATAMLMRWISTGEHPGQQVKKLAKVPGKLFRRARGMITHEPSN